MTFPPSVRVTSGPCYADAQGETEVTDDVIWMDVLVLIIASGCHNEPYDTLICAVLWENPSRDQILIFYYWVFLNSFVCTKP